MSPKRLRSPMRFMSCSLLVLAFASVPAVAQAIQLHWGDGSTALSFSENTRAVLVVQADSGATLPSSWVVNWVADSSGVRCIALDSLLACLADTAKVDSVWGPLTPADSAANAVTAHLCSAGASYASIGYDLLDLAGGSRGKLKVVALDPADSTQVIESNEVTYNGGVGGDYQPVVLGATSTHRLGELTVTARGSGLQAISGLSISAVDRSWTFPLTTVSNSSSAMTARGELAAPLPACRLEAFADGAGVAEASLAADSFPDPDSLESGCFSFYFGALDTVNLQPKDFSIVFTGDAWHIFYIRHYQNPGYNENPDLNERNFGHAVSTDLHNWNVAARNVLQVPGGWDTKHVWAPHVFRKAGDITYYMFYTGVDDNNNQKIGLATSTNLSTWTRTNSWVLSTADVPWADQSPAAFNGEQQCRDPFVMPDPNWPGQWLMYYVTVAVDRTPAMVVGVAKSAAGNFQSWQNLTPLWKTSSRTLQSNRVESPHAFPHNGKWWLMWNANYTAKDTISFEVNDTDPASPDTTTWGPLLGQQDPAWRLYHVARGYEEPWTVLNAWHATEHLQVWDREYLAAWDDYNQSIDFVQMIPGAPPDSFDLDCPSFVDVPSAPATLPSEFLLSVIGPMPARDDVGLRLALPRTERVDLAIYDVRGRRVRGLLHGVVPAGITRATWDARDREGRAVGSGIYFARLVGAGGQRVCRVALVR